MDAIREAEPAVAALAVFGALMLINVAGKVRKRFVFSGNWTMHCYLSCEIPTISHLISSFRLLGLDCDLQNVSPSRKKPEEAR
jgi:hypothetical protein